MMSNYQYLLQPVYKIAITVGKITTTSSLGVMIYYYVPDVRMAVSGVSFSLHACFWKFNFGSGGAAAPRGGKASQRRDRLRRSRRPERLAAGYAGTASGSEAIQIVELSSASDSAGGSVSAGRTGPGPGCAQAASPAEAAGARPARVRASPMRAISASEILTKGGRTTALSMRPSRTSASFIRLCMSRKGGA